MSNDAIQDPEVNVKPVADPSVGETKETGNEEEQAIPYYRFKEVNSKFKETKSELESLKQELATLKTAQPQEEKEPETWKEVRESAADLAVKRLEAKMQAEAQQQNEIEESIDRSFDQLKALGQKITPEVRKSVLEEIVKTGDSVHDAYISVQTRTLKKETSDQIKVEGQLPTSRGSEDNHIDIPYRDLHRLSTDQLIARISKK
jgi:chromosome segregation ATPase